MKEQPKAANNQPESQGGEKSNGMENGMDLGLRVLSYLIAGVGIYGLLGWLGDHYLGTGFLLPIGIIAGAAFGCYVIIRRFGRVDDAVPTSNVRGRSNHATVTEHRLKSE
ncbi:MAG TPA: AtpZ/AtpI family protein [Propionibacteriaceae bacterium]|nr:AtpZ/AtpI family protein [Propionibacteriaceae bacterium]